MLGGGGSTGHGLFGLLLVAIRSEGGAKVLGSSLWVEGRGMGGEVRVVVVSFSVLIASHRCFKGNIIRRSEKDYKLGILLGRL